MGHSWNLSGWQGVSSHGNFYNTTSAAVIDLSPSVWTSHTLPLMLSRRRFVPSGWRHGGGGVAATVREGERQSERRQ